MGRIISTVSSAKNDQLIEINDQSDLMGPSGSPGRARDMEVVTIDEFNAHILCKFVTVTGNQRQKGRSV